jgi:hypothetical protein
MASQREVHATGCNLLELLHLLFHARRRVTTFQDACQFYGQRIRLPAAAKRKLTGKAGISRASSSFRERLRLL